MSFLDLARRIFQRAEVDEIDRGTSWISTQRQHARAEAEELATLRRSVAEGRHPDLSAAVKRRNAAR